MSPRRKTISYQEFLHREYELQHAPFQPEMDFYETIRSGDVNAVKRLLTEPFHKKEGLGVLSQNPLSNLKYHLTITIAMIARYCIAGGMSVAEAYSLSDYFIRLTDEARSQEEISEIHEEACLTYVSRMQTTSHSVITSRPIRNCINYIYEHLHTRITVEKLSKVANLSAPYLSRLFKKETGYAISEYIQIKKIETAKAMLTSSNYSIAEISASLAFPSQSYFTNLFKKDCGLTPMQYRNRNVAK